MLTKYIKKVKSWAAANKFDLSTALLIFLVGLGSFGLGRLSAIRTEKQPITITNQGLGSGNYDKEKGLAAIGADPNSKVITPDLRGKYVASKSGTSYHFSWCPGAKQIKEGNKIWFQTKVEAEARGYKPAGNCPGL